MLFKARLNSCKPKEIIKTRTEYVNKIQYDSVSVQKLDSVIIRQKGDTVYYERFVDRFKYKIKLTRDTVIKTDSVNKFYTVTKTITKEKELTRAQNIFIKMGKLFVLVLGSWLLVLIYKFRTPLKKLIEKLLQLMK